MKNMKIIMDFNPKSDGFWALGYYERYKFDMALFDLLETNGIKIQE